MIAAGTPDAAWNRAKLATASPSPPLRANGASSATRWITRTGRPSGSTNGGGAGGAFTVGDSGTMVRSGAICGVVIQSLSTRLHHGKHSLSQAPRVPPEKWQDVAPYQSRAAPRTPLESPCTARTIRVVSSVEVAPA